MESTDYFLRLMSAFMLLACSLTYAGSTEWTEIRRIESREVRPIKPIVMQQKPQVEVGKDCYFVLSNPIQATAQMNPEPVQINTIASNVCKKDYVAVAAYGSVAGGDSYMALWHFLAPNTYTLVSTKTSFGVQCCPMKSGWQPMEA